ncbi:MAG: type I 3-dehydroquinate dehydratase [Treponema sp.]|nr:type I 3-dehydroquinate dehydratase [Treponema sp.]
MAKICLTLTAKTLSRNLEILDKYRKFADIAELRVDCLEPDERLLIRRFPEQAGLPVILAIRRTVDGGFFESGEGARINLMARGLAYADADKRRNFAYLDIEEDMNVPSLEEAAHTFGTRIIRSYHNLADTDIDLPAKIRTMRHSAGDIVKIAIMTKSIRDVLKLFRAGKENPEQEKILIAMGHYGVCSRILAEQFGSFLSYTSAYSEPEIPQAAPGQIDVRELDQLYRFRNITHATKVYGVTGYPLFSTESPRFFNAIFRIEEIDAVYVPFPADSINICMELMRELNVKGLSITVPYKETVISFLDGQTANVQDIGACNTISLDSQGWSGINTDAKGFSDSLLAFTGRTHLKRQRITVIGAGGSARAVVSELYRLGAKVLILNRTAYKARDLAAPYRFSWGGLDTRSIEMINKYRDIIIQTTSAGMQGNTSNGGTASAGSGSFDDPLAMYSFCGREDVMDIIYKPEMTPFLTRAANAGCRVQNGFDMLIRQAKYQYTHFTGKEFPEHLLSRVRFGE